MNTDNKAQAANKTGFQKFKDWGKSTGPDGFAQMASGLASLSMNIFGNSGVEEDKIGNRMTTDLYGRPVFSSRSYQDATDSLKRSSKGQVGMSALSGAASGASIGTQIAPGIGTAIGAIGGAIGGYIGGRRRKNQILDEVRNRNQMMDRSIDQFNVANRNFFEEDLAGSTRSFLLSERARRIG